MSLDSFLRVSTAKAGRSNHGYFVEAESHHLDVDGLHFTIKAWDAGKHTFGPAPWTGEAPPFGERLLVAFVGSGVDTPRVISSRTPSTLNLSSAAEASLVAGQDGALSVGTVAGQHLAIDGNEIQSKSSATTAGTLDLNPHGGLLAAGGKTLLSSTEVPALTSGAGALNVGALSGIHVVMGGNDVQAKSNATTVGALDLNPLGGGVIVGGLSTAGLSSLTLLASTHVTSERAGITFGDWQVGQDSVGSGTKDFFLYNPTGGFRLTLKENGEILSAASIRMSDQAIILRGGLDSNHTVQYSSAANGVSIDGPLVTGWARIGFQTLNSGAVTPAFVATSGVYLEGTRNFGWNTWGGLIWQEDSVWIRFNKGIWAAGNTVGTDGGVSIGRSGILDGVQLRMRGKGYFDNTTNGASVLEISGPQDGSATSDHSWDKQQLIITGSGAAGTAQAGIALWVPNASIAPVIRCYGGFSERVDFTNNSNTAFIPIHASAFNVTSSIRFKEDIELVGDDRLLAMVSSVPVSRYRMKERAKNLRPTERFADLDRRWQESGHPPLELKREHVESRDHDCFIDTCNGTLENPCSAVLNDGYYLGLIAEEVAGTAEEIVMWGDDRRPEGLDVGQVATAAWGAAGALTRLVRSLTARVADLESRG